MVLEEVASNLTDIISDPNFLAERLTGIVIILKTIGIAAVVYVIYVIIMGILTYRKMKKLELIEKKMESMEGKIDKLLKKERKN